MNGSFWNQNQKMIRKSIRSNDQKQLPGTGSLTANVSHWQRSRSSWLRAPEVTALTASSVSMIIRDLNQKKFYSVTLRDTDIRRISKHIPRFLISSEIHKKSKKRSFDKGATGQVTPCILRNLPFMTVLFSKQNKNHKVIIGQFNFIIFNCK